MFTTKDLRRDLQKDLADLRAGKILSKEARARAALSRAILDTVKVELSMASMNVRSLKPVCLDEDGPHIAQIAA